MKLFTASLLFSCLPLAMNSFSATINLSTGLDSTNTLITSGNVPDAHWTVVGAGPARTVFPDNIDFVNFFEPWVPNGPNWTGSRSTPLVSLATRGPTRSRLVWQAWMRRQRP